MDQHRLHAQGVGDETCMLPARTAGQVLRRTAVPTGYVRANAVFVNPETGEIAIE